MKSNLKIYAIFFSFKVSEGTNANQNSDMKPDYFDENVLNTPNPYVLVQRWNDNFSFNNTEDEISDNLNLFETFNFEIQKSPENKVVTNDPCKDFNPNLNQNSENEFIVLDSNSDDDCQIVEDPKAEIVKESLSSNRENGDDRREQISKSIDFTHLQSNGFESVNISIGKQFNDQKINSTCDSIHPPQIMSMENNNISKSKGQLEKEKEPNIQECESYLDWKLKISENTNITTKEDTQDFSFEIDSDDLLITDIQVNCLEKDELENSVFDTKRELREEKPYNLFDLEIKNYIMNMKFIDTIDFESLDSKSCTKLVIEFLAKVIYFRADLRTIIQNIQNANKNIKVSDPEFVKKFFKIVDGIILLLNNEEINESGKECSNNRKTNSIHELKNINENINSNNSYSDIIKNNISNINHNSNDFLIKNKEFHSGERNSNIERKQLSLPHLKFNLVVPINLLFNFTIKIPEIFDYKLSVDEQRIIIVLFSSILKIQKCLEANIARYINVFLIYVHRKSFLLFRPESKDLEIQQNTSPNRLSYWIVDWVLYFLNFKNIENLTDLQKIDSKEILIYSMIWIFYAISYEEDGVRALLSRNLFNLLRTIIFYNFNNTVSQELISSFQVFINDLSKLNSNSFINDNTLKSRNQLLTYFKPEDLNNELKLVCSFLTSIYNLTLRQCFVFYQRNK